MDLNANQSDNKNSKLKNRIFDIENALEQLSFENEYGFNPVYIEDTNKLLSIFPEEIWILITDKIDDLTTTQNLFHSSLFFRKLLLPSRTRFMFPDIWNIISISVYHKNHQQLELKAEEEYERAIEEVAAANAHEDQETIDNKLNQLRWKKWFGDILNLRLVCKKWCETIDNFYTNLSYKFNANDQLQKSFEWLEYTFSCWMEPILPENADHLHEFFTINFESFARHFEKSHGESFKFKNPFLGRRVSFIHRTENHLTFFNKVLLILSKYGHHIWYLKVDMKDVFPTCLEWYLKLREILNLVPNLKSLHVILCQNDATNLNYSGPELRSLEIVEEARLIHDNGLMPLPQLCNLKYLRTEDLFCPVFNEIVRKHKDTFLSLEVKRKAVHEDYELFVILIPYLRELEIKFFSEMDFEEFESSEIQFPLEKLHLDLKEITYINWSRIPKLLETKWGSSLKNLELNLSNKLVHIDSDFNSCNCSRTKEDVFCVCCFLKLNLKKLVNYKVTVGTACLHSGPYYYCANEELP